MPRQRAGSLPEQILQTWFDKHGIIFIPQFRVNGPRGIGAGERFGDIYLPLNNLIVLVDGAPFHANPEERSSEEMFYRANGFYVARIPADFIAKNVDKAVAIYLPQVYGQPTGTSVEPFVVSGYGRGRRKQIKGRIYRST